MTTSKPDYYAIERELFDDDLFDDDLFEGAPADVKRIAIRMLAGFYYAALCETDADGVADLHKIEKGVLVGILCIIRYIRYLAAKIEETMGEQKSREMKVGMLEVLKSALTPRQ